MRRVVYLMAQPFDERNYERFGIGAWLLRRWAVEVWDLTPWVHPQVWRDFISYGKQIREFAGYFAIGSAKEFAQRLAASGAISYFIDLTDENVRTTRAKLRLMRAGAVRVKCSLGSIPVPDPEARAGLLEKATAILQRGPAALLNSLTNAFFYKLVARHMPAHWAIVAGERSIARARHSRHLIRAHNFDYDTYLDLRKSTCSDARSYVVFIDQDYCFHPEYVYQNVTPLVTPERYFPAVCRALTAISQALDVTVRIAAHPRSTYPERGGQYFGGFPLEYGRTGELIRDASVVVCHDSTAIQFAVLFSKPVIFLTTDQLIASPEGRSIAKAAAELGKSPINLDQRDPASVDWHEEIAVDPGKYASYICKYIKAQGSRDVPVWDIVIDELETAENHGYF